MFSWLRAGLEWELGVSSTLKKFGRGSLEESVTGAHVNLIMKRWRRG